MSELDLEAIKARVGERVINIDQTAIDNATGVDLAMVVEIWRLHKRLTITDDMVERAALAMAGVEQWPSDEELGGNFFTGTRDDEFRDQYICLLYTSDAADE